MVGGRIAGDLSRQGRNHGSQPREPRQGKEAQILVQAVVDAYLSQVVAVEKNQRRVRLDQLERTQTEHSTRIRTRRNDLKELAERLGTTDQKALSIKQQVAMEQFTFAQRSQGQAEFELRKAKSELDTQKAMLQGLDELEISDFEVEQFAKSDPMVNQDARRVVLAQAGGPAIGDARPGRREPGASPGTCSAICSS